VHEVKYDIKLHRSIVHTLLYFDIFNYPLKEDEIYKFLRLNSVSVSQLRDALLYLTSQQVIYKIKNFYSTSPLEENVWRRTKGNAEAERQMPHAKKIASFISRFPFVRAVMISGSLSKGYMDDQSDFDFFIITKPKRLWVARMILVLYKRIFLKNSHKQFCVNYFVDTDHLEIEEKNIFTATELATVVPCTGNEYYQALHQNNNWLHTFFPNYVPDEESTHASSLKLQRVTEFILNLAGAGLANKVFMKVTFNRWKKRYGDAYSKEDFSVAFKSKEYASKNHPNHFQKRVVQLYHQRVESFDKRLETFRHEQGII
jgi:hypothetical protein